MKSNNWLKRIFSIEFASFCVALIAAYFAYIPIKSYFSGETPLTVTSYGREVTLNTGTENLDTVKILAYTHQRMKLPLKELIVIENTSDQIVKGLNVETDYYFENSWSILTDGWQYIRQGTEGTVKNTGTELSPFGKVFFPFDVLNQEYSLNSSVPEQWACLATVTSISFEGCKKEKKFAMILTAGIISDDSYDKNYGNPDENRRRFNEKFLQTALQDFYNSYNSAPHLFRGYTIMINLFGGPQILSVDEALHQYKKYHTK